MNTNSDTPSSEGTGLAGAATAFEAILTAEDAGNGSREPETSAPAEADEAEALASTDPDETPPEDAEDAEAEGAEEEEASAEDEENEPSADPLDELVTVKVGGKNEQIPLREALAGYSRQADYSRKTAALSEERRSFEAERQQVTTERAQYAQLLDALGQQLETALPQEPDWERLYATDPLEYVRQKDLYREHKEQLEAVHSERQRMQTVSAQEQAQRLSSLVQEGRQKLVEAVPAWKDKAKWEADRVKILEYGQKLGFDEQELSQTYDPRAVIALHKAMRYDEMMAKRPVPSPQKGPRPIAAGSSNNVPRSTSEVTKAKQRLAKTGRVQDAAKLFERFVD